MKPKWKFQNKMKISKPNENFQKRHFKNFLKWKFQKNENFKTKCKFQNQMKISKPNEIFQKDMKIKKK